MYHACFDIIDGDFIDRDSRFTDYFCFSVLSVTLYKPNLFLVETLPPQYQNNSLLGTFPRLAQVLLTPDQKFSVGLLMDCSAIQHELERHNLHLHKQYSIKNTNRLNICIQVKQKPITFH